MAGNGPPPPPPPPPPVQRGPGGQGGGPGPLARPPGPGPLPPPPPGIRPPGPMPGPGPQQMQMPIRQQISSTRFVDITPRVPMGEDECKKKLISLEAHTIRKIVPFDSKREKSTWAKSEITRESLAPEEISRQVKKLNESRRSVADKKQALQPYQQGQINRLLDELNSGEIDPNFQWSLAQLDTKIRGLKNGQRETTTITCYVKRSPLKDLNPVGLYNALERQRAERIAQLNRPPPPPPPPPPQQQQQQPHGGGNGPPPGVVKLPPKDDRSKPPRSKKYNDKKYDDRSSVSSDFESDTESGSDYSSSENTSMSSRSGRHQRRHSHHGRSGSHSRRREHNKKYYINDRIVSPEPRFRDPFMGGPRPTYVPEPRLTYVPEAPRGVPAFDPVAAAYQAGKIDADAERFGVDQIPRIRPLPEPRAIVTYGRPEPRYDHRLSEARPYISGSYVDDRFFREREDDLRRRESEAEAYMTARSSREPRVAYTAPNPFEPRFHRRSYAPSHDSYDSWP